MPAKATDLFKASTADGGVLALGFVSLCALLLSGYLNDWSYRLLGGKAYLSTVCIVLVPAIWLMSGQALGAFQTKAGLWWTALVMLLLMGVPFSVWPSMSLIDIWTYIFRSLSYFFYVVAFATTLRRCRALMYINIGIATVVAISCMLFGAASDNDSARFQIADSFFLSNSNELALQCLLGICAFMFLFYSRGIAKTLFAVTGILASFIYMIKTGSRGCLLSAIVLMIVVFAVSRRRVQLAVVIAPVIVIALLVVPSASLHRITLIFEPATAQTALTNSDIAALGSTAEREELLKKGLEFTVKHPLFGVGMGQFAVAYVGEAAKKGEHAPSLGTHNSYTQVSAECGIPAFICYMAILSLTLSASLKIYRRAHARPQLHELEGLAFCLFTSLLVYSIATFFFHMAFTVLLPMLSGQVVALQRAAEPVLRNAEARPA